MAYRGVRTNVGHDYNLFIKDTESTKLDALDNRIDTLTKNRGRPNATRKPSKHLEMKRGSTKNGGRTKEKVAFHILDRPQPAKWPYQNARRCGDPFSPYHGYMEVV